MVQTHHSPPEGVRVALEVGLECVGSHGVLLGEVDEVAGEDETEEADVQRRDQLLQKDLTLVTNLKGLFPGVPSGSRLDLVDFVPQSSQFYLGGKESGRKGSAVIW